MEGEAFLVLGNFPGRGQTGLVLKRDRIGVEKRLEHEPEDLTRENVVIDLVIEALGELRGEGGELSSGFGKLGSKRRGSGLPSCFRESLGLAGENGECRDEEKGGKISQVAHRLQFLRRPLFDLQGDEKVDEVALKSMPDTRI